MLHLQRVCFQLLGAIVCLPLTGCGGDENGEPMAIITGKILQGGQPVVIEDFSEGASCLEVALYRLDESDNVPAGKPPYAGTVMQDGTFGFAGADGKGIPAGKYRVGVRRIGSSDNPSADMWKGKFDGDKAPFTIDVPSTGEVVLDLAQAGGK